MFGDEIKSRSSRSSSFDSAGWGVNAKGLNIPNTAQSFKYQIYTLPKFEDGLKPKKIFKPAPPKKLCITNSGQKKWLSAKALEINNPRFDLATDFSSKTISTDWIDRLIGISRKELPAPSLRTEKQFVLPPIPVKAGPFVRKVDKLTEIRSSIPAPPDFDNADLAKNPIRGERTAFARNNTPRTSSSSSDGYQELLPIQDPEDRFQKFRLYPEDMIEQRRQIETPYGWN